MRWPLELETPGTIGMRPPPPPPPALPPPELAIPCGDAAPSDASPAPGSAAQCMRRACAQEKPLLPLLSPLIHPPPPPPPLVLPLLPPPMPPPPPPHRRVLPGIGLADVPTLNAGGECPAPAETCPGGARKRPNPRAVPPLRALRVTSALRLVNFRVLLPPLPLPQWELEAATLPS